MLLDIVLWLSYTPFHDMRTTMANVHVSIPSGPDITVYDRHIRDSKLDIEVEPKHQVRSVL